MPSPSSWSCILMSLIRCFFVASSLPLTHRFVSLLRLRPISASRSRHHFLRHCSSDVKALKVGEEIKGETMPLNSGQRTYELLGLRRSASYEVKISYPASIPASFSIQLQTTLPELWSRKNRRLLNTEKLIFKADNDESAFVILTVDAAGVVAKPNVPERELVIYNIVCDELMLGIPHGAWWVGVAALLCLLLGILIPSFFPLHLLLKDEDLESENIALTKVS
ncbi:unnamed protein product [Musa hybrid cultivar]